MINVLYVTFASKNFDGATYSLMDLINQSEDMSIPLSWLGQKDVYMITSPLMV